MSIQIKNSSFFRLAAADLYDAEHSVVYDQRRVVPRDDRTDENPLDKIPCGHLDVKPVSAVLHTGFKHLEPEKCVSYLIKKTNTRTKRWRCVDTLTVSASMTSLKFLFPAILFFMALTASLGLE